MRISWKRNSNIIEIFEFSLVTAMKYNPLCRVYAKEAFSRKMTGGLDPVDFEEITYKSKMEINTKNGKSKLDSKTHPKSL